MKRPLCYTKVAAILDFTTQDLGNEATSGAHLLKSCICGKVKPRSTFFADTSGLRAISKRTQQKSVKVVRM